MEKIKNYLKNISGNIDWVKWLFVSFVLALAIITRVLPQTYPTKDNKVEGMVFDEAYFIPQSEHYFVGRYYFDIHPPLSKLLFALGGGLLDEKIKQKVNEEEHKEILRNKVDNFTPALNFSGARNVTKFFSIWTPVFIFLILFEISSKRYIFKKYNPGESIQTDHRITLMTYIPHAVALLGGIMIALENSFIVDSRFVLITQILIAFMVASLYFAIKYLYSERRRDSVIYLLLISIFFGLAISTKQLSLGFVPAILACIFLKHLKDFIYESEVKYFELKEKIIDKSEINLKKLQGYVFNKGYLLIISLYKTILTTIPVAVISILIFVCILMIHFKQFTYIRPDDNNLFDLQEKCAVCADDLQNNTKNASTIDWVMSYIKISDKYNANVPELDYAKKDEIGSEWAKWPIMARPILTYWASWNPNDNNTSYNFFSLIGNPLNWLLSFIGIIGLTSVTLSKLTGMRFGDRNIPNSHIFIYILIIGLYFSNWLPFAFIKRVMYLYHYLPAMMIGIIAFCIYLKDFILPTIFKTDEVRTLETQDEIENQELLSKYATLSNRQLGAFSIITILIIFVFLSFVIYSKFTYAQSITRDEFIKLNLIRDWNLTWPADKK